jgi:hypothetical protein
MIFVVHDVPWVVLGQWTFQFGMDSQNKPTISLYEKGVIKPFVFTKSSPP